MRDGILHREGQSSRADGGEDRVEGLGFEFLAVVGESKDVLHGGVLTAEDAGGDLPRGGFVTAHRQSIGLVERGVRIGDGLGGWLEAEEATIGGKENLRVLAGTGRAPHREDGVIAGRNGLILEEEVAGGIAELYTVVLAERCHGGLVFLEWLHGITLVAGAVGPGGNRFPGWEGGSVEPEGGIVPIGAAGAGCQQAHRAGLRLSAVIPGQGEGGRPDGGIAVLDGEATGLEGGGGEGDGVFCKKSAIQSDQKAVQESKIQGEGDLCRGAVGVVELEQAACFPEFGDK